MAETKRSPITFPLRGLSEDVRLVVFDQMFLVHSITLKSHSSFFRTFLKPSGSSETASKQIQYEYGSVVDDDGSWGLQKSSQIPHETHSKKSDQEAAAETSAFAILLHACYGKRYSLSSVDELQRVVKLADYYCCLPILSTSLDANMQSSVKFTAMIPHEAEIILPLACAARAPLLFREAFIHVVGKSWLTRSCTKQKYEKSLAMLIQVHQGKLDARAVEALEGLLNPRGLKCTSQYTFEQIQVAGGMVRRMIERELSKRGHRLDIRYKAHFYRSLYHCQSTPDPSVARQKTSENESLDLARKMVQQSLGPLLEDCSVLDSGRSSPGDPEWSYFLCTRLPDDELPWDQDQTDW
ncbi:MAG: hypothetical protein M1837_004671 [Sclerophora amabilis]|nr:MAG: hypothetical protein M1837_004671 [Sclerophora amabilis]